MPFANHRGQRIHYTVEGSGPLTVLQHGLLLDAASWKQCGVVDALADRFRVACVDSLGHGLSDKPADPEFYDQEHRAGDVVAVIDDFGHERAHVVGHSMGGWVAVGVARFFPARLASPMSMELPLRDRNLRVTPITSKSSGWGARSSSLKGLGNESSGIALGAPMSSNLLRSQSMISDPT